MFVNLKILPQIIHCIINMTQTRLVIESSETLSSDDAYNLLEITKNN